MKKVLYTILGLSLSLLVVSCSSNKEDNNESIKSDEASQNDTSSENLTSITDEAFSVLQTSRNNSNNYSGDLKYSIKEYETSDSKTYDINGKEIKGEEYETLFGFPHPGVQVNNDTLKKGTFNSSKNTLLERQFKNKNNQYVEIPNAIYYFTKDDKSYKFVSSQRNYADEGIKTYADYYVSDDEIQNGALPIPNKYLKDVNFKNIDLFKGSFKYYMDYYLEKDTTPFINAKKENNLYYLELGVKENDVTILGDKVYGYQYSYRLEFDSDFIYSFETIEKTHNKTTRSYEGATYNIDLFSSNILTTKLEKNLDSSLVLDDQDKSHLNNIHPIELNRSCIFKVPQLHENFSKVEGKLDAPLSAPNDLKAIPNVTLKYYSDMNMEHEVDISTLKQKSYSYTIYVKIVPNDGYAAIARLVGYRYYHFDSKIDVVKLSDSPSYSLLKTWSEGGEDYENVTFKGAILNGKSIDLNTMTEINLENQKVYTIHYYYDESDFA